MLHTSFLLLRKEGACKDRYVFLQKALGPGRGKNTPIPLITILEHNGLEDAFWALRAVPKEQERERDQLTRLFACRCIQETPLVSGGMVWDLLRDPRSKRSLVVAERFLEGLATITEVTAAFRELLKVEENPAESAVWAAVSAVESAAWGKNVWAPAAWNAAVLAAKAAAMASESEAVGTMVSKSAAWTMAWENAKQEQEQIFKRTFG